jgi:hypothetical protein
MLNPWVSSKGRGPGKAKGNDLPTMGGWLHGVITSCDHAEPVGHEQMGKEKMYKFWDARNAGALHVLPRDKAVVRQAVGKVGSSCQVSNLYCIS